MPAKRPTLIHVVPGMSSACRSRQVTYPLSGIIWIRRNTGSRRGSIMPMTGPLIRAKPSPVDPCTNAPTSTVSAMIA